MTPKVPGTPSSAARLAHITPQLAIIALIAVALPYAWMARSLPFDALLVNTGWALWVVWILSGVIGAALQSRAPIAATITI